jgi:hypothetical protein
MKHIKTYKIFENVNMPDVSDVKDMFQDFVDEWDLDLKEDTEDHPYSYFIWDNSDEEKVSSLISVQFSMPSQLQSFHNKTFSNGDVDYREFFNGISDFVKHICNTYNLNVDYMVNKNPTTLYYDKFVSRVESILRYNRMKDIINEPITIVLNFYPKK